MQFIMCMSYQLQLYSCMLPQLRTPGYGKLLKGYVHYYYVHATSSGCSRKSQRLTGYSSIFSFFKKKIGCLQYEYLQLIILRYNMCWLNLGVPAFKVQQPTGQLQKHMQAYTYLLAHVSIQDALVMIYRLQLYTGYPKAMAKYLQAICVLYVCIPQLPLTCNHRLQQVTSGYSRCLPNIPATSAKHTALAKLDTEWLMVADCSLQLAQSVLRSINQKIIIISHIYLHLPTQIAAIN